MDSVPHDVTRWLRAWRQRRRDRTRQADAARVRGAASASARPHGSRARRSQSPTHGTDSRGVSPPRGFARRSTGTTAVTSTRSQPVSCVKSSSTTRGPAAARSAEGPHARSTWTTRPWHQRKHRISFDSTMHCARLRTPIRARAALSSSVSLADSVSRRSPGSLASRRRLFSATGDSPRCGFNEN